MSSISDVNCAETAQPRNVVNLLEQSRLAATAYQEPTLVRFDGNETPVVPFTADAVPVDIHFVDDPDYRGYLRCAGSDCLLCRVGNRKDKRSLLPVYLPVTKRIGLVALSDSMRPGSLKPQVVNALGSTEPKTLFIQKTLDNQYRVQTFRLSQDTEDGRVTIAAFKNRCDEGNVDLAEAYPLYTNQMLAEIGSISRLMKLKGITLDENH